MTNRTLVLGLRGPIFGKTGLPWCERDNELVEGRERGSPSCTVLGSLQLRCGQPQLDGCCFFCRIHCPEQFG